MAGFSLQALWKLLRTPEFFRKQNPVQPPEFVGTVVQAVRSVIDAPLFGSLPTSPTSLSCRAAPAGIFGPPVALTSTG